MSSDPNKSISGEVGEGTGLRDEKSGFDDIDQMTTTQDKKKPLILIGGKNQIRCHRCGTSKNNEDKGIFIQINNYIGWFHNKECHDIWIDGKTFKTGALLDEYGREL